MASGGHGQGGRNNHGGNAGWISSGAGNQWNRMNEDVDQWTHAQNIPNNLSSCDGDRNNNPRTAKHKRCPQWEDPRGRNVSVPAHPIKETAAKLPDANQLLGRLMHIRECIKQVTANLESVKKSGDSRNQKEQIHKFSMLLSHLQSQENESLTQLQRIMSLQNEDGLSGWNASSDVASGGSEAETQFPTQKASSEVTEYSSVEQGSPDENIDPEEMLRRNELLKKMLESQEKLKSLQEQQSVLVALQHSAENRLQEARAFRNQLLISKSAGDGPSPIELQRTEVNIMEDDLDNLQQRLNLLKNLYDNKRKAECLTRTVTYEGDLKPGDYGDHEADLQRQELQDKLRDLQEKKRHMDELLLELRTLQESRDQRCPNNETPGEQLQDGAGSSMSKYTVDMAQDLLRSLDASDKLRSVEDAKNHLHQMQDMVESYHASSETGAASVGGQVSNRVLHTKAPSTHSLDLAVNQARKVKSQNSAKVKKSTSQKKDNISREHSNEYLARNLNDGQVLAYEGDDGDDCDEIEDWHEVQLPDKTMKMESAKDKLRKLQDLLSAVTESQVGGEGINMDLAHQIMQGMDDDEASQAASSSVNQASACSDDHRINESISDRLGEQRSRGAIERRRRSGAQEVNRMFDQRAQLEQLIEDQNKILMLHEQHRKKGKASSVSDSHDTQDWVSRSRTNSERDSIPKRNRNIPQLNQETVKSNQDKQPRNQDRQLGTNKNTLPAMANQKVSLQDVANADSECVTSNQEIWTEMRQRLILREELRQKRRELEDLMKKDKGKTNSRNQDNMSDNVSYSNKSEVLGLSFVGTEGTTAATWGGSTQENPDDDQDEQTGSQEELDGVEDNEAYSSEEMGPAEEEESVPEARKNDSHMVQIDFHSDIHCARNRTVTNNMAPVLKSKVDVKDTQNVWNNTPIARGLSQSWSSHNQTVQNPTLRSSEEVRVEEQGGSDQGIASAPDCSPQVSWHQQAMQLNQQLEQTNSLCQTIMRDQFNLAGLLHQSGQTNPNTGFTPAEGLRPPAPEFLHHYSQQLQIQQLLMNLNQCYHLLYVQQLDIQQLQHQLQQALQAGGPSIQFEGTNCGMPFSRTAAEELDFRPMATAAASWFNNMTSFAQCSPTSASDQRVMRNVPSQFATLAHQHELGQEPQTLNNQVPPGVRANNYWDNFRSYSRQNLLSSSAPGNKSNGTATNVSYSSPQIHALPLLPNRPVIRSASVIAPIGPPRSRNMQGMEASSLFCQAHVDQAPEASFRQSGLLSPVPKLDLEGATNKKSKKEKVNKDQRQTEPKASTRSDSPMGATAAPASAPANEKYKPGLSGTSYTTNISSSSSVDSPSSGQRELGSFVAESGIKGYHQSRSQESDAPSAPTLFDTLKDSIYAEVATLISRNESRPQYLMQMFRQLQLLNSDFLRQNALIALHELALHPIPSEASSPSSYNRMERQGAFGGIWSMVSPNTTSDKTAAEGLMTSEEEELRTKLLKMSKSTQMEGAQTLKQASQFSHNPHYDYPDSTSTTESLSTPATLIELTFDSLPETVLHVNKIKEVNQRRAKLGLPANLHGSIGCLSPEGASSSAQDQGSETSNSDVPYSGVDTSQLDDKIQSIMLNLIPFLKAHLEDVCSQKLLLYVRQLTMSLASQPDEALELTPFFHKQLSSVLHDTLKKYTGKRLGDCGEDLLVDVSEVIFQQLIFLRIKQNMENRVGFKPKARNFHTIMQMVTNSVGISPNLESSPMGEPIRSRQFTPTQPIGSQEGLAGAAEATDADMSLTIRLDEDELSQGRDDAMVAMCDIAAPEDANRMCAVSPAKSFHSDQEYNCRVRIRNEDTAASNESAADDMLALRPLSGENREEHDPETEEGLEDNQDLAEADQSQSHTHVEKVVTTQAVVVGIGADSRFDSLSSEDLTRAEATEDDQGQRQEGGACGGVGVVAAAAWNGETRGPESAEVEQGLDEVPIKLRSLPQEDVIQRLQEEESNTNNLMAEILGGSAEVELVDSKMPIRKPDSQ